jgi:prephenate dehydratase
LIAQEKKSTSLGPVWDCSTPTLVALLLNFSAKQVQLHKLYSRKKVEFRPNSMFFLELLKRYSRNQHFVSPHGVGR